MKKKGEIKMLAFGVSSLLSDLIEELSLVKPGRSVFPQGHLNVN